MKSINVVFEDKEIKKLEKMKNGKSWRKFILDMYTKLKEADRGTK